MNETTRAAQEKAAEPIRVYYEPDPWEQGGSCRCEDFDNLRAAAKKARELADCPSTGACGVWHGPEGRPTWNTWRQCVDCALDGDAFCYTVHPDQDEEQEPAPVTAEEWDYAREHGRTIPVRACSCEDYPCCIHADSVAVIL